MAKRSGHLFGLILLALFVFASTAIAQGDRPNPKPKEVLLDSAGNTISNNEFRDYSLSDPQRKDPFTRTVLPDGTVELRLKKNLFEGNAAPIFGLATIDGKTITPDGLKGKVLVLNFWFIGCPGCMEEIPKLNELVAKYRGREDVVFLALALDPPSSLAEFIKKVPFNYIHSGNARAAMDLFGVKSYPRNVVIGRDGKIVYWRSTIKAWEKFDAVIKAELGK
jgi:peroxiredoxin